jgi:hypothetical protein
LRPTVPVGAMRAAVVSLATIASLGLAGVAQAAPTAAAEVPSEKITLDVTTVNGSGCKPGTAGATALSDNTGFRINYKDFIARDGGSADPTEFRRNCQVNVVIHVPQGFTYAIWSADYRGRASLHADALALHRTTYYFQGSAATNVKNHTITGPYNGSWISRDVNASQELVYAPCGEDRSLNVNTELRVYSPNAPSWISMRTSEGDVETVMHFSWKRC